tara:strand:- start:1202 stop:1564 length:363 start_codon:yes stop_codon:yes gene_type:complete
MKIVIEDWYLQKEYQATSVWCHDKGSTGGYIIDDKEVQTSYRLVGTKAQIREWADKQDFILDEVYGYRPIEKDSYWDGICCHDKRLSGLPTRAEYNKKFYKTLKEYSKLYKENENKLLIL